MRFVPPYETTPPIRSKWSKVVFMRLGVVLTLFLGLSAVRISPLAAQSKKLYFHHLNTRNGLSQSFCSFIYRDKSGYIWISSTEGLMRYDGQVVHHYHANPDDPLALFGKNVQSPFFEDEQGNLWFATSEAIHVYRKQTDDFEHFFIQKNNAKLTDVSYCILFYEPGQRLAVAINNEEVYWLYPSQSGKSGTAIAMPYAGKVWADRCYALPESSTGKVRTFYAFIRATSGIYGFGKYEVRGDSIYQTGHYFYGENKQPALSIKALTVDKSGIVWLSTNKGLVRFDISAGNWWYCNTLPEGNSIGSAQGHVPDGADKLWVSTDLGLGLFNTVTQKFESLYAQVANSPDGPAGPTSDLYLDPDHVLWCTIYGTGVDFTALNKPKFSILPIPEEKDAPFMPTALEEDAQGNIWIGSNYNPLKKYTRKGPKKGTWVSYPFRTWRLQSLPNNRMFVATMEEISFALDIETNKRFPVKTSTGLDITFGDVYPGDDGTLWGVPYVRNGGLWKIRATNDHYEAQRVPAPLFSFMFAKVYQDQKGHLYLAKEFNSLLIYSLKDTVATLLKRTNLQGETKCFYEDDKYVWVGGEFGLCRIDKETYQEKLFEEKDGLPGNMLYGILPDDKGHLWLSTNRGILRFDPDSLQIREYSLADGLQDYEYNTKSYLKTRDGQMWFGGIKGLNVFYPNMITDLATEPSIAITRLQINDLPDTLRRNINQVDSLVFPFSQNTLSFDFVALDYSDPARNKLSYRLTHTDGRPYDDNWVACENAKGFVRYPNLPAGEYYFDIRGSNSDGKFSPNIKRLYLKIRPPFYQTTQFYLMMFLAIASILYIIVREVFRHQLRLKNIQLREQRIAIEKQDALTQERNRIAAEMHDDFGSGLTAIQRISERAAINASSPDARKAIENITSYSLELIGNMREIIWAMSGKNDNLENLMAYISENAYRYLGNHNIDVDILQPEEIPDLEISGERRRNIYLAVKESLHNVVKHAQASSVAISFEINGMLEIHVRDNGKGFENKNLLGYGMGNMAKRMEDIGGKMTLLNNGGAHLKFSIPIEKFKPR